MTKQCLALVDFAVAVAVVSACCCLQLVHAAKYFVKRMQSSVGVFQLVPGDEMPIETWLGHNQPRDQLVVEVQHLLGGIGDPPKHQRERHDLNLLKRFQFFHRECFVVLVHSTFLDWSREWLHCLRNQVLN